MTGECSDAGRSLHSLLVDLVLSGPAEIVVDLGAGRGDTLAETAARAPASSLTAVDIDGRALAVVAGRIPGVQVVEHDLVGPLPFQGEHCDCVVSHNVLECLVDPPALLRDIARVLRPGGRAVLGHTDFESIVVAVEGRALTRRVLQTYADLPVLYEHMAAADPWMGRKLAGLVRRSPLSLESVRTFTTVHTELSEARSARLDEVMTAVRRSAERGLGSVTVNEVDEWQEQLCTAQAAGEFFFAETAFVVVASKP
ncbi:methyltransferase type 11 [Parafrankia colletiae]|uniref:Methyltransferase type 11 n=1 Tax=Parafrankia colletiae TaxID=573497 RepID=A0A1S1QIN6_9ACTN|nr:methyltransferase type 11 [Parafrankia colletiae]